MRRQEIEEIGPWSGDHYFGWIALTRGLITLSELTEALEEQKGRPRRKIGQILKSRGGLSPGEVAYILRIQGALRPHLNS